MADPGGSWNSTPATRRIRTRYPGSPPHPTLSPASLRIEWHAAAELRSAMIRGRGDTRGVVCDQVRLLKITPHLLGFAHRQSFVVWRWASKATAERLSVLPNEATWANPKPRPLNDGADTRRLRFGIEQFFDAAHQAADGGGALLALQGERGDEPAAFGPADRHGPRAVFQ